MIEKCSETKIRYLELIQNVITRMANNSFMLKGWAITLVAAIFAYGAVKRSVLRSETAAMRS